MKSKFFSLLVNLMGLIKVCLLLFVFFLLVVLGAQFVDNPQQFPTLIKINKVEQQITQPMIQQIKLAMPYKFSGKDYSKIILIFLLLFLAFICASLKYRFQKVVYQIKDHENYYDWRSKISASLPKAKLSEIDNKFEMLNATKPADRKQILKEFALLKGKLDSMGQQLAFLAIDVVDSTGMKRDEDKYVAANDFNRYNEVVEQCLKENGVIKFATTPDGLMSCFRTVDSAVNAAVCLIDRLKVFNQSEKQIKQSFQVRCGINAGFVYMDNDTPLEQISDRVIDIAGHMQKYAKPDSINIAASAIEPLRNRGGFYETTDVIDEQKVYEWSGK